MRANMISMFAGLLVILVTVRASAHIRMTYPPPRTNADDLKVGPCGGVERGAVPSFFEPGETVRVEWDETIDHPGWYRIAVSYAGDSGFDENVVLDNIVDRDDGGAYSVEVTLPDWECDECTLQLIQVMTDRDPPTLYFACADLVLSGGTTVADPDPDAGDVGVSDAGFDVGSDPAPEVDSGSGDVGSPDAGAAEDVDAADDSSDREVGAPDGESDPRPEVGVTDGETSSRSGCSVAGSASQSAPATGLLVVFAAAFVRVRRR